MGKEINIGPEDKFLFIEGLLDLLESYYNDNWNENKRRLLSKQFELYYGDLSNNEINELIKPRLLLLINYFYEELMDLKVNTKGEPLNP